MKPVATGCGSQGRLVSQDAMFLISAASVQDSFGLRKSYCPGFPSCPGGSRPDIGSHNLNLKDKKGLYTSVQTSPCYHCGRIGGLMC